MSSYLNEADSDSDSDKKGAKEGVQMSDEQKESVIAMSASLKSEGNGHFSKSEFEEALVKYTAAVNLLKESNLPRDSLILLNRSATYLALKRYVPALNDANQGKLSYLRLASMDIFIMLTHLGYFCFHSGYVRPDELEGTLAQGCSTDVHVQESLSHKASYRGI